MARATAWRQGWALASMIVAICPPGVCFTTATSSGPRLWECAGAVMCIVDRAYQNTTHTYCRLHRSETVFCGTRTWNAQQPAPTPRNMQSFFVCALSRQGPREAEQFQCLLDFSSLLATVLWFNARRFNLSWKVSTMSSSPPVCFWRFCRRRNAPSVHASVPFDFAIVEHLHFVSASKLASSL